MSNIKLLISKNKKNKESQETL